VRGQQVPERKRRRPIAAPSPESRPDRGSRRNSTGRKNRIIGTVSFGGKPAAFFSASDMRMSRFSCDMTRSVVPIGVP
jgi:hypothetical protein